MSALPESVIRIFWGKIELIPFHPCWEWTGGRHHRIKGYGTVRRGLKKYYAHRVSYEIHNGPIPAGLVIDHICRNTMCVNPRHLRAVTSAENTLATGSLAPSNISRQVTQCPHGHPYDDRNTYRYRGHRQCTKCRERRNREYVRPKRVSSRLGVA